MRLASIGTSWITESFIDAAKTVEGIEYTVAYSRSAEKAEAFASRNSAKITFTSLEELASSTEIDAVYIGSPNVCHYEQSRLMLSAGKHVICEKPIAVTPAQVEELQALAREKGLVYMEAIMFLHIPQLKILKDAMGKIGKITSAHFDFSQLSSKYSLITADNTPNIFNPAMCAGCLMDIGVYNVYIAAELFGFPEKITAVSHFMETGADSHGVCVLDYSDKQITLNYSKVGQSYSHSQIFGDLGTIRLGSISQLSYMSLVRNDRSAENLTGEISRREIMSGEARAFYNYITEPEKYACESAHATSLALEVSRIMAEIRRQNPRFRF